MCVGRCTSFCKGRLPFILLSFGFVLITSLFHSCILGGRDRKKLACIQPSSIANILLGVRSCISFARSPLRSDLHARRTGATHFHAPGVFQAAAGSCLRVLHAVLIATLQTVTCPHQELQRNSFSETGICASPLKTCSEQQDIQIQGNQVYQRL